MSNNVHTNQMQNIALTDEQVADYLTRNPDFLSRNADILSTIAPPSRWEGNGVVDMQQVMLERLREEIENLRTCAQELIETGRSNMSTQSRTHSAVIAILSAKGLEALFHTVSEELALLLNVDVVSLSFEPGNVFPTELNTDDIQSIDEGTADRILGEGCEVRLIKEFSDDGSLFGAASSLIHSAALIRVHPGPHVPQGILALGSRGLDTFDPGQGTELINFLARILERTLQQELENQT